MIAIVNCHGDWFHTQKRGVNGAFLVLTVLQKENLPEATSSSITCSICTSSTFPSSSNSLLATFPPSPSVSQTAFVFGLISSLQPRFILIIFYWLFQNCSQHCLSVSAPPRVSLSQKRSDGGMKDVLNWTIIEIPKDKQDYLDPIYSPTSRIWNPSHNMSCCNLTLWIDFNK